MANLYGFLGTLIVVLTKVYNTDAKVLLVSMDGFRWDYINKIATPNFDKMAQEGVRVPYITSTFTTKTFPCHYSIATGLYEESHGIIANVMYDPVFNETFHYLRTKSSKWWDGGYPLWNLVQKHGLRSGVYYWPGSEFENHGLRPNIWRVYNESVPFRTRVDSVVDWLTNTSHGVDLALLYFHEPDFTGHRYRQESQEVLDKVAEMDGVLGYIVEKFVSNNLWDTVNLVVTSDHGMVDIDPINKSIDLASLIDISAIDIMNDFGPITHIKAVAGREDELYNNMSRIAHMQVFKKQDIPDYWHYKNNRRILPILGVADEGWSILKNFSAISPAMLYSRKGGHGYDNRLPTMKPIFYARGPNIKRNYTVSPFESVDIYPLVAALLGIEPEPNNGTLDNVKDFLVGLPNTTSDGRGQNMNGVATILTIILTTLVGLVGLN